MRQWTFFALTCVAFCTERRPSVLAHGDNKPEAALPHDVGVVAALVVGSQLPPVAPHTEVADRDGTALNAVRLLVGRLVAVARVGALMDGGRLA